ncbi:Precorrin-8X methylmutase [Candidatus Hodgkinia cicadicola]|nr:Precorrin-8X methylmutase [Candidatus Hodgkinia cicadicola]
MARDGNQIMSLSLQYANVRLNCEYWTVLTRATILRLCYCFGFNVFKYCVYSDGFLRHLLKILSEDSMIVSDTNALGCMLSPLLSAVRVRVCSITDSDKVAKLARRLRCTKSCIQLDVWVSLLSRVKYKNLVFAIATSPTSLLRLLELVRALAISPSAIIACCVGVTNCNVSKRKLWLSAFNVPFLLIRGKAGGVAFGAAVLNSFKHCYADVGNAME